jgi:hypothetical protein
MTGECSVKVKDGRRIYEFAAASTVPVGLRGAVD